MGTVPPSVHGHLMDSFPCLDGCSHTPGISCQSYLEELFSFMVSIPDSCHLFLFGVLENRIFTNSINFHFLQLCKIVPCVTLFYHIHYLVVLQDPSQSEFVFQGDIQVFS